MNNYEGKTLFESWYIPDWKKPLGSGSFGTVYELVSKDNESIRTAVKIISIPRSNDEYTAKTHEFGASVDSVNEEYCKTKVNVIREIELMLKVSGYTNCVGCTAYRVEPHVDCFGWDILIQMEMLESLDMYFRRKGIITNLDITALGIDLCRALEACEEHNIIHRDIKPANIMVKNVKNEVGTGKVHYKLGDFGVARVMLGSGTMTMSGSFDYMAPELLRGEEGDLRVDIYSLGIMMYQLLNANRFPFMPNYPKETSAADTNKATQMRLQGAALTEPLYAAGTALAQAVLKACEYDKEKRYCSASEMRVALEAVLLEDDERTIFSVPPVGKYQPSDRKLIVKIYGNTELVSANGKMQCVVGFTTNIKGHGVKVELKPGIAAKAGGKAPGKYPMGLTRDSFIVTSAEEGLEIADVLVTDGYIEIAPKSSKFRKKKIANNGTAPKKKKSKRPIILGVAAIAVVVLICSFSTSPPKTQATPTPYPTSSYDRFLYIFRDPDNTQFDTVLVGVWNLVSEEHNGDRKPASPSEQITIHSDGTYSDRKTPRSQGYVISTHVNAGWQFHGDGMFENCHVEFELSNIYASSIPQSDDAFKKMADNFHYDIPLDRLEFYVTGEVQESPTAIYSINSTFVYERDYHMESWLTYRLLGSWSDNFGNTWEFFPDDTSDRVGFKMTDANGNVYDGYDIYENDLKNTIQFLFERSEDGLKSEADTFKYNVDYFNGNKLELSSGEHELNMLRTAEYVPAETTQETEAAIQFNAGG